MEETPLYVIVSLKTQTSPSSQRGEWIYRVIETNKTTIFIMYKDYMNENDGGYPYRGHHLNTTRRPRKL